MCVPCRYTVLRKDKGNETGSLSERQHLCRTESDIHLFKQPFDHPDERGKIKYNAPSMEGLHMCSLLRLRRL